MSECLVGLPLDYIYKNHAGRLIVPIALRGDIPVRPRPIIPARECVFRPLKAPSPFPAHLLTPEALKITGGGCCSPRSKPSLVWYKKLLGFIVSLFK